MKICSCLNKGVMIAVAVVCSASLQSCLDDNDKYYYVEGFPNALVTVKNATDGSFFLQLMIARLCCRPICPLHLLEIKKSGHW